MFGQGRSCRRLVVGGSPAWLGVSSGGLFCWLVELVEGDGVAECFELALEASGKHDEVAKSRPIVD